MPSSRIQVTPSMPRRVVLAVAVVLMVSLSVHPVDAAYRQIEASTDEVTGESVVVVAPAVAELSDGTLQGVPMQMEVTVRDGSGGVYVDTRPLTQVDMQGSARLAATMSSSLAGADMADHDFFVTTRSPAPAVGGPSAGAAMTVAFTALLMDLPIRDDVVMTGMINPDGSVGPVGGILEKAEAAHKAGADIFLIPEGQAIVTRTIREVQDGGWFPTVTTREERVDAVAYAREQWGLEVRETTDIYEAIEWTTDHRIERPDVPEPTGRPLFEGVMRGSSREQLDRAVELHETLRARLGQSDAADGPNAEQLSNVLDRAETRLAEAESAFLNGSYYTASSLAFQGLIDLRNVELWLGTLDATDDRAYLQGRGTAAADRLETTRRNASAADPQTVSSLEAVGAAQVRVLEAARLLDQAQILLADDRLPETVQALAFGIERTRSVDWWLDIAGQLGRGEGGAPLRADPADLATDYFGIAQQAVIYAEVLTAQTGADAGTSRLVQEATAALEDAQTARSEGLLVGALYLSMEAQVAGHGALSLLGSTALIEDRIDRQRDRALIQIAQTRDVGAEPFLAVSYLEFASSLEDGQPLDALLMYGNAATIAATSGMLATGDVCGFGALSCGADAPAVARVAVPGPDPWTAYFALATVVLGFMAGVLVTLVVLQTRDRRGHPHTAAPAHLETWRRVGGAPQHALPARPVTRPRRRRAAVPPPVQSSVVGRGPLRSARTRAAIPPASNAK